MTSTSERWLAFLDADVLAHPRSRSLVLFGSRHPDTRYAARWSPQVEAEADRALAEQDAARQRRPEQTGGRRRPILVSALRGSPSTTDWSDWVLVPDASEDAMATLVDTAPGDRHVLMAAMHEAFPDVTPVAAEASPREVFRGYRCLVCGRRLTDPAALRTGVGPECGLA